MTHYHSDEATSYNVKCNGVNKIACISDTCASETYNAIDHVLHDIMWVVLFSRASYQVYYNTLQDLDLSIDRIIFEWEGTKNG